MTATAPMSTWPHTTSLHCSDWETARSRSYSTYSATLYIYLSGSPSVGVQPPPKDHKINLRSRYLKQRKKGDRSRNCFLEAITRRDSAQPDRIFDVLCYWVVCLQSRSRLWALLWSVNGFGSEQNLMWLLVLSGSAPDSRPSRLHTALGKHILFYFEWEPHKWHLVCLRGS